MSTAKRVYFYAVAFITLGIFAAGVTMLLSFGLEAIKSFSVAQVGAVEFAKQQFSLGLAMLIIGGPLWFVFWRAIQRQVYNNQSEVGSGIRKFFLNLILLIAAFGGFFSGKEFLKWLLSGVPIEQFSPGGLAILIVAGLVWYGHWRIAETEGAPSAVAKTLRRWYVYVLSACGLVWLSVSIIQFFNVAMFSLRIGEWSIFYARFWNSGIQDSLAWIVLSGPLWAFHWFRMPKGDFDSTLRQVYIYLLAIAGGSIAGLAALTTLLYKGLTVAFRGGSVPIGGEIELLGWTIPTVLVAAAVWVYHRSVALEEAAQVHERYLSAQRVQLYLMSFLGLGTLISGLVILLGIILGLIIDAVVSAPLMSTSGWWRNQLSLSLALLIIAAPLWFYYWNNVLRRAEAGGIAERRAMSRRIFLYVILGSALIALVAAMVNIVYQVLNGVLQGALAVEILRRIRWSTQGLIVAVPVLMYHWRILRQDQRLGAETAVMRKIVTMLVSDQAMELVVRIEEKLGYKVYTLCHLGQVPEEVPVLADEELTRLTDDIKASPGTKVLLVVHGGRIIILPYQEK